MKVKLLKKVRKRYVITYYPKGVALYDNWHEGPLMVLKDTNNSWRTIAWEHDTKEELFNHAFERLKIWITRDYKKDYKRNKKVISEKLWY